jgi:hypothetical protein
MTGCNKFHAIILISILCMAVARFACGSPVISDNLAVSCIQSVTTGKLHCDYRLLDTAPVHAITANAENKSLTVKNTGNYPWHDAVTAILLLVDTSDPGRQNVIEQNKQDIARILASSGSHHRIGLARFDKSLRLEAPIGSPAEQITAAASRLRAVGQTTELYRSVLTAIEMLGKVNADRKSIFILSDGLVEDTAYFHQDVVKAANQAGVVITSLGYPRSIALSVGLQTLRRLSDETGGMFVETDMSFKLPEEFLNNPMASIDNGGRFDIDLMQLPGGQNRQNYSISISFETAAGNYHAEIPVTLPAAAIPKAGEPVPAAAATATGPATVTQLPTQQPIVITREPADSELNLWLWYGIPAALIVLLVITIVAFFLMMSSQGRKKQLAAGGFNEFKPYAYLVVQDETKKRYPITNTIWRIGRGTDNEMTLRDSSVSRRHAEIDRDKGDVFTIIDLDSTNGVYVNNEKIRKHILHEGDIIEIGDINLRFTLLPAEYTFEEVTEMQNTRSPFTH